MPIRGSDPMPIDTMAELRWLTVADLADILRLVENYPDLKKILPDEIKNKV